MAPARNYELTFLTATVLEWKHLLANDTYKDIIINSLRFFVINKKIQLNAFVIMNNHMHLIWHIFHPYTKEEVQGGFLRFTAKSIIKDLKQTNAELLNTHKVDLADRKYQIWERNPLSIDIWSESVLKQKLDYIHNNPVKAGYCSYPEEYKYSTATLYSSKPSGWEDFITPCYL